MRWYNACLFVKKYVKCCDFGVVFIKSHYIRKIVGGAGCGFVNALLGAGGGMIAVPILSGLKLDRHKAHANSVAVIMPLSIISASLYLNSGNVSFLDVAPLLPTGLLGAWVGTSLLGRLNEKLLRKIFALFMIWAGMRLILK